MRKGLLSILKKFKYHSVESEKILYNEIIDGVINAQNSGDLKPLLHNILEYNWIEKGRCSFLIGLIYGALMQYNKKTSIEGLENMKD